jgi:hypothetical protein
MSSLTPITLAPISAGSVGANSSTSAPLVVDEAHAPASVRQGSAAGRSSIGKQAYASAQGFEEMLLQQLSQSLVQSSGLSGEGESSGEEGSSQGSGETGMLSSLLPQTLTEGVMREGGLGLATQLMRSLDPSASAGAAGSASGGATGGVSAPASAAPAAAAAPNGPAGQTGGASA